MMATFEKWQQAGGKLINKQETKVHTNYLRIWKCLQTKLRLNSSMFFIFSDWVISILSPYSSLPGDKLLPQHPHADQVHLERSGVKLQAQISSVDQSINKKTASQHPIKGTFSVLGYHSAYYFSATNNSQTFRRAQAPCHSNPVMDEVPLCCSIAASTWIF